MSTWSGMNAAQRNHFVGELIGAKPLSQCYLAAGGVRVLVSPYTEEQRGKLDAMIVALKASDDVWAEMRKANSHITDEMRDGLEVDVERWHIRYSDTPGGAWEVVEWLRGQGYVVQLRARPNIAPAFRVSLRPACQTSEQLYAVGASMPEAVCRALFQLKAPEVMA
jgi:hypothetical protein